MIIDYCLLIMDYGLSLIGYRILNFDCQIRIIDYYFYRLLIIEYGLWINDYS